MNVINIFTSNFGLQRASLINDKPERPLLLKGVLLLQVPIRKTFYAQHSFEIVLPNKVNIFALLAFLTSQGIGRIIRDRPLLKEINFRNQERNGK